MRFELHAIDSRSNRLVSDCSCRLETIDAVPCGQRVPVVRGGSVTTAYESRSAKGCQYGRLAGFWGLDRDMTLDSNPLLRAVTGLLAYLVAALTFPEKF